jgi:8-oxo-dGTP pyrophosphatase MutT (NUDIX family)
MKLTNLFGRIVHFFGYPFLVIGLRGSTRAYILVRVGDEILFTKNIIRGDERWRLPGGGVHKNELPINAAIRELHEELGIVIEPQELTLLRTTAVQSKRNFSFFVFDITFSEKPVFNINKLELLDAQFIDVKDASLDNFSGETVQALELAK